MWGKIQDKTTIARKIGFEWWKIEGKNRQEYREEQKVDENLETKKAFQQVTPSLVKREGISETLK